MGLDSPTVSSESGKSPHESQDSPIDDLNEVAPLILNVESRDEVLAKFDADSRLIVESVLQAAGRLTSMTEWSAEVLLEELGCTVKTRSELESVGIERLKSCERFLGIVARNVGLVDTRSDRRFVVVTCARMLKSVGQDTDALEKYLQDDRYQYTAIDLLRMGEIHAAGVRILQLVNGEESSDGPFASVEEIHLSPARVDLLVSGERELLGSEVAKYMELHIEGCDSCRAAVSYREGHPLRIFDENA
jgi:hypothetical protein